MHRHQRPELGPMQTLLGSEQEQICISPRDSGAYLVAGRLKLAQGRKGLTMGVQSRSGIKRPGRWSCPPSGPSEPPLPQLPRALLCPGGSARPSTGKVGCYSLGTHCSSEEERGSIGPSLGSKIKSCSQNTDCSVWDWLRSRGEAKFPEWDPWIA